MNNAPEMEEPKVVSNKMIGGGVVVSIYESSFPNSEGIGVKNVVTGKVESQLRPKGIAHLGDTVYGEIEQTYNNGKKDTICYKGK